MAKGLFVVVAVLVGSGVWALAQSKPTIQGVWRVAEVNTTGPNATTNKNPQPSVPPPSRVEKNGISPVIGSGFCPSIPVLVRITSGQIVLVLNWLEELKRLVPVN
jgi:hypothetical protein